MAEEDEAPPPGADVMRLLIATDNHLGYGEKCAVRSNDSFVTFDEILEIGLREEVDFVLLGGDLFHENKPSRQTYMKCVEILRSRVFGDRPLQVHLVSDPNINFAHCSGRKDVNYTDPNLNIGLPIFSVHGNHDDPAGVGGYSVLDNLHATGLVNYFGKISNLKEVSVSPLLLVKGNAKLALYGISSLKDERLHRLFRENNVHFYRPEEDMESWFNLLVLHQNRARHGGPTNFIPEHFIEGFFDLVLWGHEHECRITPEKVVYGDDKLFHVTQPGSSVGTSLCEGETKTKKVAVVEIHKRLFKMKEVELQTVRPMVFRTISIEDNVTFGGEVSEKRIQQKVERFLVQYVQQLLDVEVPKLLTGHDKQPKLPLVRVRVEYTDEKHQLNASRFGNNFLDKVANPTEILLFKKRVERRDKDDDVFDELAMERLAVTGSSMEDLISLYFKQTTETNKDLTLLGVTGISAAVKSFIEKNDREAVEFIVNMQLKKALESFSEDVTDENVDEALALVKGERAAAVAANCRREETDAMEALEDNSRRSKANDQTLNGSSSSSVKRGGKAAATRGRGRSRGRGRGKKSEPNDEESDPSAPSEEDVPEPPKRLSRRGGGGRANASRGKTPVVAANNIRSMFLRQSQRSQSPSASSKKSTRSSVIYETESDSN